VLKYGTSTGLLGRCSLDPVPSPEEVLSKSQRNDIYRAIEKSGAFLAEFYLEADDDDRVTIIHRPTKSFFHMFSRGYTFNESFITGEISNGEGLSEARREWEFNDAVDPPFETEALWPNVTHLIVKWARAILKGVEESANAPDLWAGLGQSSELLATSGENTSFTAPEQAEISGQIRQVREYINTTYKLTAEQLSEVKDRLDHAEQASRRMGRKDWLMLFNGAVFSLVLSDLIPSQAVQHILIMTLHGIGHLFGIGGVPPHLPPGH
jgi:hypothetical protein